jgi:amidase
MMSQTDELAFMDATAQAELVRRREMTALELVNAAIERIERLNPMLNAVVTSMYEQAREAASKELPQGPFTGVPFLLKDLISSYTGVRMTAGSALLRDYVPDHDSELVGRQKRAGLVILGKTNTPEFGILGTTEPDLLGPCRNPWNMERTTGGSSGGSAAAVASGMVPMAHGNDGAGSLRIPASCCGVFGLKPTRGRNPLGPDYGDLWSGLIAEHAITRSVRDSAALLDATAGTDVGDPYWAPPPTRVFIKEVGASLGQLRIAFSTASLVGPVHSDCVSAVHEAAKLCTDLGHEVVEATPAMTLAVEQVVQAFMTVHDAGVASDIDAWATTAGRKPSQEQFEPLTWAMYQMGRKYSASEYLLAVNVLQRTARDIARFFARHDVWLTPTLAEPPVPLGTFASPPENPLAGWYRSAPFAPFTPICNFTGQPAMSVPLFWNGDGLPVGTHFIGRFGDEATLFRLAAQLEQAQPWAAKRPPVRA